MEDLFSLLVFAVFIWSMISGAKKGKSRRPAERQTGRRPDAERPMDLRGPFGSDADPAGAQATGRRGDTATAEAGGASVLVPDDLWEILTGERRAPGGPAPRPRAEARDRWEPEFEEESLPQPEMTADDLAIAADPHPYPEVRSLEEIPPPAPAPVIVSLDGPPPPAARRHAAFHERLDATSSEVRSDRARRLRGPLVPAGRSGLQRAVILREVLGPPKGLED